MAATNIRQFTLGVRRFVKETETERRRLTRAVALRALRGVVLGTRVDTGRARGNWQATEGSPASGELDRADAAGSEGTVDTLSLEGRKILAMRGDDIIWLHNGVPYIGVLEDKDKMVAGNVQALRTWLRSRR